MKRTLLCPPLTIGFVLLLLLFVPPAASVPLDAVILPTGRQFTHRRRPVPWSGVRHQPGSQDKVDFL
jgi:hypothetical protein